MNFIAKIIYKVLKSFTLHQLKSHIKVSIGKNIRIGSFTTLQLSKSAKKIVFSNKVNIRNYCNFLVGNEAELRISENVFMNNYCSINCLEKIEIGENTLFGEAVKLYDHNHLYSSKKVEHQQFTTSAIKIGKNCWLGSNVTVLKGVTIGDNCIIGANVLVYKDVPNGSVIKLNQELS